MLEQTFPVNQGPEAAITQTYGQKAVGVSFNPSNLSIVDKVKQTYADLIDLMNEMRAASGSSEQMRHCSIAITDIEAAQMRTVKAITWKD